MYCRLNVGWRIFSRAQPDWAYLTHSNVQKLAINCVCVSQNLRLTLTFLTNLALKYVQAVLCIAHVTNQVLQILAPVQTRRKLLSLLDRCTQSGSSGRLRSWEFLLSKFGNFCQIKIYCGVKLFQCYAWLLELTPGLLQ